jgi:hypothetical protein
MPARPWSWQAISPGSEKVSFVRYVCTLQSGLPRNCRCLPRSRSRVRMAITRIGRSDGAPHSRGGTRSPVPRGKDGRPGPSPLPSSADVSPPPRTQVRGHARLDQESSSLPKDVSPGPQRGIEPGVGLRGARQNRIAWVGSRNRSLHLGAKPGVTVVSVSRWTTWRRRSECTGTRPCATIRPMSLRNASSSKRSRSRHSVSTLGSTPPASMTNSGCTTGALDAKDAMFTEGDGIDEQAELRLHWAGTQRPRLEVTEKLAQHPVDSQVAQEGSLCGADGHVPSPA